MSKDSLTSSVLSMDTILIMKPPRSRNYSNIRTSVLYVIVWRKHIFVKDKIAIKVKDVIGQEHVFHIKDRNRSMICN